MSGRPLLCRLLGCAWRFGARESELVWVCARGCGNSGQRGYESAADARRHARLLNRGKPGPPVGFLAALGGTVTDRRDL